VRPLWRRITIPDGSTPDSSALPTLQRKLAATGFAIRTGEHGGTAWLFLSGELDLATAPLVERSLCAAQRSHDAVVVDLEDLSFMDASGVALFLDAAKRAGDQADRFGIVNSHAPVRRVFEATRTTFLLGDEAALHELTVPR
jgi:anti-sigma B factor antagonist